LVFFPPGFIFESLKLTLSLFLKTIVSKFWKLQNESNNYRFSDFFLKTMPSHFHNHKSNHFDQPSLMGILTMHIPFNNHKSNHFDHPSLTGILIMNYLTGILIMNSLTGILIKNSLTGILMMNFLTGILMNWIPCRQVGCLSPGVGRVTPPAGSPGPQPLGPAESPTRRLDIK